MTPAEAAATYQVPKGWVSKLMARYEGEAACEAQSRRPKGDETVEQIVRLRRSSPGKGSARAGQHRLAFRSRAGGQITVQRLVVGE